MDVSFVKVNSRVDNYLTLFDKITADNIFRQNNKK